MTSKEALNDLRNIIQAYFSMNDKKVAEELNQIENDLEVLEILKKYLQAETMDNEYKEWEVINSYLSDKFKEDFKKIKEWLERE